MDSKHQPSVSTFNLEVLRQRYLLYSSKTRKEKKKKINSKKNPILKMRNVFM